MTSRETSIFGTPGGFNPNSYSSLPNTTDFCCNQSCTCRYVPAGKNRSSYDQMQYAQLVLGQKKTWPVMQRPSRGWK